jgi:hypothetical protein
MSDDYRTIPMFEVPDRYRKARPARHFRPGGDCVVTIRLRGRWSRRLMTAPAGCRRHVTKIYAVQEFIDGEWVDLEFEWVQPLLAVKGPSS